jgi:hypothetical protein
MRLFLSTLLFASILSAQLFAGDITFQNGTNHYEGASDANLIGQVENRKHLNFGHADRILVAGVAVGGLKQLGVIQFSDLTGPGKIPAGARILRATLELYKVGEPTDSGQYARVESKNLYLNCYRMLKAWKAGEGTGQMVDDGVTFSYRAYRSDVPEFWGNSNQIEEGPVKGIDYDPAVSSRAAMQVGAEQVWMQWDVTPFVRRWVKEPESNHGVMLMARSYYVGTFFASCESGQVEFRPRLIVEY